MSEPKDIGRVRELIKGGMTQKEACEKAGVSYAKFLYWHIKRPKRVKGAVRKAMKRAYKKRNLVVTDFKEPEIVFSALQVAHLLRALA